VSQVTLARLGGLESGTARLPRGQQKIGVDYASSCRRLGGRRKPQKWDKMAKLNRRRRWRGPALGGRLQRGVRFCFTAHDCEAATPTLTEWARPEIVHAGRRPTAAQMVNQARALRSIGAKRVRRAGRGWVWRLSDSEAE
jgi:hypothetical protein